MSNTGRFWIWNTSTKWFDCRIFLKKTNIWNSPTTHVQRSNGQWILNGFFSHWFWANSLKCQLDEGKVVYINCWVIGEAPMPNSLSGNFHHHFQYPWLIHHHHIFLFRTINLCVILKDKRACVIIRLFFGFASDSAVIKLWDGNAVFLFSLMMINDMLKQVTWQNHWDPATTFACLW